MEGVCAGSQVHGVEGRGLGLLKSGLRKELPETIRLGAVLPGGDRLDRGSVRVRFFPDGGGEEAEISVTAQDGGALRVTVDPLTGLSEAGT